MLAAEVVRLEERLVCYRVAGGDGPDKGVERRYGGNDDLDWKIHRSAL